MNAREKLAKAREFSPGIAEWIDAQLARGLEPEVIVEVLTLTTTLAIAGRKLKETAS